jgi:hypothetical protein
MDPMKDVYIFTMFLIKAAMLVFINGQNGLI